MYKFFNDFKNDDFFQWIFKKRCFKKICTNFSKEKVRTKDFSMIFKCFKICVQRNIFLWFLSMFIQKVGIKIFFKYFLYTFKRIFQWFFCLNAYVQRIKKKSQEYVQTSKRTYVQKFFFFFFSKFLGNHWVHGILTSLFKKIQTHLKLMSSIFLLETLLRCMLEPMDKG